MLIAAVIIKLQL